MDSSERRGDALEPPPAGERTVIKVGLAGAGLAAAAALAGIALHLGKVSAAWAADYVTPVRVILSIAGMIVAGAALTMRPRWPTAWLVAALTSFFAAFGFPLTWDSFRLVAFAFAGVAAAGAVVAKLPPAWRIVVGGAAAVFHFSGIFSAVTMPHPMPILTNQIWTVIFRPYQQFAYLTNAYQFYSPDPGPASELWLCIEYETLPTDPVETDANGKPLEDDDGNPVYKKPKPTWMKIPRREKHFKDPLGQAYYRRLSLTENVTHGHSIINLPQKVQDEIVQRRNLRRDIPLNLFEYPLNVQYRMPYENTQSMLLPSYVRHVAKNYQRPDRAVAGVRVYRVLHAIVHTHLFVGGKASGYETRQHPYDPTTYMPYYLGHYGPDGELLDKNDPMLYWLVPITRNPSATADDYAKAPKRLKLSDYHRLYDDYVTRHAGSDHMEGELDK